MNQISVAVAEDFAMVRQGLVALLNRNEGIEVKFDVENGLELIQTLESSPVDVVLLDLDMPVMNGHEALKILHKDYPSIHVIIISMHDSKDFVGECILGGAKGFLPKNSDIEKVVEAIQCVVEHGYYLNEKLSPGLLMSLLSDGVPSKDEPVSEFTEREIEVVQLLCQEKTAKEISEILFLSPRTVETHRTRIFDKTNSKNVAGMVVYAIKNGIYNLD